MMSYLTRLSVAFAFCGVLATHQSAQAQVEVFEPSTDFWYTIIECTRGERLAVGDDDNVLRWNKTGNLEQLWSFTAKGSGTYVIQSLKYHKVLNNRVVTQKVLDVNVVTGNISVFQPTGAANQEFKFFKIDDTLARLLVPKMYEKYHDQRDVDFVIIKERTKDEHVAIIPTGNAQRWPSTGDGSQVFILRKQRVQAGVARKSYDPETWSGPDARGEYTSAMGVVRTIYNPLDGGVLLKFRYTPAFKVDACSAGSEPFKKFFKEACIGHDIHLSAPWKMAGFPRFRTLGEQAGKPFEYTDSQARYLSVGQDLSDYLFLKDMLFLVREQFLEDGNYANYSYGETDAYQGYRYATLGGLGPKGYTAGDVMAKGGVVAVRNNGGYVMRLRVSWISPDGAEKVEDVLCGQGETATIPLSLGSRKIVINCWAQGNGQAIISETKTAAGMYAYTVDGVLANPKLHRGVLNQAVATEVNVP